ncbi:hypothetical protein BD414DRAFT_517646 [Trametes punicea]|nr:hypothetical protein BD414DRAFT_517646 [Trametes punicea]
MSNCLPQKLSKPPAPQRLQFRVLNASEAAREKGALTSRRKFSEMYIKHLFLTEDQRQSIEELHRSHTDIKSFEYSAENDEDQVAAAARLAGEGLELSSKVKSLGNRWSIRWSRSSGRGSQETCRQLYQCDCGYHEKARETAVRKNPVPFTGCLAHAEVFFQVKTGQVLLLRGYFEHNPGCKEAFLLRIPPMPLHPAVFTVALKQLQSGAQLAAIQETNRTMFRSRSYLEQPQDLRTSQYRWLLQKSDTRSLYRQFNRLRGVNITVEPHINVDEWLNPSSPAYKKAFADSVFHYSARAAKDERFEVCVATKEMREAAWRYSHGSQLILDGTFGLCDRKLLLFIIMGVDERKRAPSGNQQTASGYDTNILEKLLSRWRASLGTCNDQAFTPRVAITDTDLKERGALLRVFPAIWLLICKFHLRQAWRNHRTRVLKGTTALHTDLRARLQQLELTLLKTTDHAEATQLIINEQQVLSKAQCDTPIADDVAAISGARAHLEYLVGYWLSDSLWKSWSEYGRQTAAKLLGCEVDGVIPTTNHLESFNGVLKNKHVRRWQRGGRRLRVDVLLHLFVFSVLPSVFEGRALEEKEDQRIEAQLRSLPGGDNLIRQMRTRHGEPSTSSAPSLRPSPHAYLTPDAARDASATLLLENNQISVPTFHEHTLTFGFDCFSSLATTFDVLPTCYNIAVGLDGSAACSCLDFRERGGACKHVRAAIRRLKIPPIDIPQTHEDASTRFKTRSPYTDGHVFNQLPDLRAGEVLPGYDPTEAQPDAQRPEYLLHQAAQLVEDSLREAGDVFLSAKEGQFLETSTHSGGGGTSSEDLDIPDAATGDTDTGISSGADVEMSDAVLSEREGSELLAHERGAGMELPPEHINALRKPPVQQIVARVLHELDVEGPKMRQLGEFLVDAHLEPHDVERARIAKAHIDVLTAQLSRLLHEAETPERRDSTLPAQVPPKTTVPDVFVSVATLSPPPSLSSRRKRKASPSVSLLPPSPEKSQKRQDSHSIH